MSRLRYTIRYFLTETAWGSFFLIGCFALGVLLGIIYRFNRKKALPVIGLLSSLVGLALIGILTWKRYIELTSHSIIRMALLLGIPLLITLLLSFLPFKKNAKNESIAPVVLPGEGMSAENLAILEQSNARLQQTTEQLQERVNDLQCQIDALKEELTARPAAPVLTVPDNSREAAKTIADRIPDTVASDVPQIAVADVSSKPAAKPVKQPISAKSKTLLIIAAALLVVWIGLRVARILSLSNHVDLNLSRFFSDILLWISIAGLINGFFAHRNSASLLISGAASVYCLISIVSRFISGYFNIQTLLFFGFSVLLALVVLPAALQRAKVLFTENKGRIKIAAGSVSNSPSGYPLLDEYRKQRYGKN